MKKYDKYEQDDKAVPFSQKELDSIDKAFSDSELPIHYVFRSETRINKETKKDCAVALSPHYVICLQQDKTGKDFKSYASFHISKVKLIAFSHEEFVLVQTSDTNLVCTAFASRKFAQLLYRNYTLSYYQINDDYDLEIRSTILEMFPEIDIYISPSQRFQFTYNCLTSKNKVSYRHEIVRYIHSLLISMNGMINFNNFPSDLLEDEKLLIPFIETLKLHKFVTGYVCEDRKAPYLLDMLVRLMKGDIDIRFVHLKNCDITNGIDELVDLAKSNGSIKVSHWDLSGNELKHIKNFLEILDLTTEPVYTLSLNDCGFDEELAALLFQSLKENKKLWEIRKLELSGIELTGLAYENFEIFLKHLKKKKSQNIEILNLSNIQCDYQKLIDLLRDSNINLKHLDISHNNLPDKAVTRLIDYIKDSETLTSLDLSYTNLDPDLVADVIDGFGQNEKLSGIKLHLNGLGLHKNRLVPIFRAFLSPPIECDKKWSAISLDSNELDVDDLRALIPFFKQFPNLNEVSLSYNFNRTMPNISGYLVELVNIPSLKSVKIVGNDKYNIGLELYGLISSLKTITYIKELDITGHKIGDQGTVLVAQMAGRCIEKVSIDDTDMHSIEVLMQLEAAAQNNKNLIGFGFPSHDARRVTSLSSEKKEKKLFDNRIGDLQVSIALAIAINRAKKGLLPELPFEIEGKEKKLLQKLSDQIKESMVKENLRQHSCVGQEFYLPLPCQKYDESIKDIRDKHEIHIGNLEQYQTDSMKYAILEPSHGVYTDIGINELIEPNLPKTKTESVTSITNRDVKSGDSSKKKSSDKKKKIEVKPEKKSVSVIQNLQTIALPTQQLDQLDEQAKKAPKPYPKKNRKFIGDTAQHMTLNSSSSDEEVTQHNSMFSSSKKKGNSKKPQSKRTRISDSDDEQPAPKRRNIKRLPSSSSDDELKRGKKKIQPSDSSSEERRIRTIKLNKKKINKYKEPSSDSSPPPPKKGKTNRKQRKYDDDSSDSSEHYSPPPVPKRKPKDGKFIDRKPKITPLKDESSDELVSITEKYFNEDSSSSDKPRKRAKQNIRAIETPNIDRHKHSPTQNKVVKKVKPPPFPEDSRSKKHRDDSDDDDYNKPKVYKKRKVEPNSMLDDTVITNMNDPIPVSKLFSKKKK